MLARSSARLELLRAAGPDVLAGARRLVDRGHCAYEALPGVTDFRVEATLTGGAHWARCVLSEGQANVDVIERDGSEVFRRAGGPGTRSGAGYRQTLKAMPLPDLLAAACGLDDEDRRFVGELSVVCGCAIAAAIAAAGAVVYQHAGLDLPRITHAINNVIGDLSGLICDGAKPGCSTKTVSGVDAALRAAFMALEGFGLSDDDGVLGLTAAESIRNLARVSVEGMLHVDPTVVDILRGKSLGRGEGRA